MDGQEVIGLDVVLGIPVWLGLALTVRWIGTFLGRQTALGMWGVLHAGGFAWLLSFEPPVSLVSGLLIVAACSWMAGRVVIEQS